MSFTLGFDLDEALKREEIEQSVLDKLRHSDIPGMPDSISDHQLLLFYRACQREFDDTRNVIKEYYEHKRTTPEHFTDRNPLSAEVQQCLDNQLSPFVVLIASSLKQPTFPTGSTSIYPLHQEDLRSFITD